MFPTFVLGNMESVQYDVHAAAFWTKLGEIFKCLFYLLVKMMLIVSTSFFFFMCGGVFCLFFSQKLLVSVSAVFDFGAMKSYLELHQVEFIVV